MEYDFPVSMIFNIKSYLAEEQYTQHRLLSEEIHLKMQEIVSDYEEGLIEEDNFTKRKIELKKEYILKFVNNLTKDQQKKLAEYIMNKTMETWKTITPEQKAAWGY